MNLAPLALGKMKNSRSVKNIIDMQIYVYDNMKHVVNEP